MSASTAPAVKAALLTLLRADAGLTGVQIEYADPGAELTQESVFYGRTVQTEAPSALGQRAQWEKYDIEIYVYVTVDGNDPQTTEERAWAVESVVDKVVRANNGPTGVLTAALPLNGWVVMGASEMTPFTANGQRVCEVLCRVHVEAKK